MAIDHRLQNPDGMKRAQAVVYRCLGPLVGIYIFNFFFLSDSTNIFF